MKGAQKVPTSEHQAKEKTSKLLTILQIAKGDVDVRSSLIIEHKLLHFTIAYDYFRK